MKFSFGQKNIEKPFKGKDSPFGEKGKGNIDDDEDITKGLSEEDVRKALNLMGRAMACTYLGTSLIAASCEDGEPYSPLVDAIFKSYVRRSHGFIDPIIESDKLRNLIPIGRV